MGSIVGRCGTTLGGSNRSIVSFKAIERCVFEKPRITLLSIDENAALDG